MFSSNIHDAVLQEEAHDRLGEDLRGHTERPHPQKSDLTHLYNSDCSE